MSCHPIASVYFSHHISLYFTGVFGKKTDCYKKSSSPTAKPDLYRHSDINYLNQLITGGTYEKTKNS